MSWKDPRPAEFSANRNLLGSFSLFFGDTLVLQIGDTVGPRYTAPKISAISYLFRTFLFINNGGHRTTALYRFPRSIGPRYNGAAVYMICFS